MPTTIKLVENKPQQPLHCFITFNVKTLTSHSCAGLADGTVLGWPYGPCELLSKYVFWLLTETSSLIPF